MDEVAREASEEKTVPSSRKWVACLLAVCVVIVVAIVVALWRDPYLISDFFRGGEGKRYFRMEQSWLQLRSALREHGDNLTEELLEDRTAVVRVRKKLTVGSRTLWVFEDARGVSLAGISKEMASVSPDPTEFEPCVVVVCSTPNHVRQEPRDTYWLLDAKRSLVAGYRCDLPPVPGCIYHDKMTWGQDKIRDVRDVVEYPKDAREFFKLRYPELFEELKARGFVVPVNSEIAGRTWESVPP